MVLVACPCGHDAVLACPPSRSFVECPRCGRRLPVRWDPAEFVGRCPKCGRSYPHRQGVPCLNERCEDCGVALIREGSAHHEQLAQRRGETGGAATEE